MRIMRIKLLFSLRWAPKPALCSKVGTKNDSLVRGGHQKTTHWSDVGSKTALWSQMGAKKLLECPKWAQKTVFFCIYSPLGLIQVDSRRRRVLDFIWQIQCRSIFALPPSPPSLRWPSCKFSRQTGTLANRTGVVPASLKSVPSWGLNRLVLAKLHSHC